MEHRKLTTAELEKMVNRSRKTIHNWREDGLPFHKDKNLVFFYADEVSDWLKMKAEEGNEFQEMLRRSETITIDATIILSTFNKTAERIKKAELLKESGVRFTEDMESLYESDKTVLSDLFKTLPNILVYKDRMKELLTVIKTLLDQKPTKKVQKDLIEKYTNELEEITMKLEGSK